MAVVDTRDTSPSYLEHGKQKFLIFDAPTDENLHLYIRDFAAHKVKNVVRVCDSTYSTEPLKRNGITVHELPFPDGERPPDAVIDAWLNLGAKIFENESLGAIGIHCVAGLGRAPVLVAIALIESGLDPLEAVTKVRSKRRKSINQKQLQFLLSYKRRSSKKCVIM